MRVATEMKLAVLIDAENISHQYIKQILDEISKFGAPTIKRIYTDWTQATANGWKNVLLDHAITPVQQYRYTSGKNATDSAMIIDAMDILYSGKVEGFCIVSSDSDFTRLCNRLREAGMKVFGFGEKKTPKPFIASCDKFTFIELLRELRPEDGEGAGNGADVQPVQGNAGVKPTKEKLTAKVTQFILSTIDEVADDSGWATLGEVGTLLLKKQPEFDSRVYGYSKLSLLLKNISTVELKQEEYVVSVRVKD